MLPKRSFPCSQQPITGPCPKSDKASTNISYYFKTHFNINFHSTPRSFCRLLSFKLANQNPLRKTILSRRRNRLLLQYTSPVFTCILALNEVVLRKLQALLYRSTIFHKHLPLLTFIPLKRAGDQIASNVY